MPSSIKGPSHLAGKITSVEQKEKKNHGKFYNIFFIQICQASGSNLYIDILKEPSYLAGKITFVVQKKKKIMAKNMCLKFYKKMWIMLIAFKNQ